MSELLNNIKSKTSDEIAKLSVLVDDVTYTFDQEEFSINDGNLGQILKTSERTVVSLNHSVFNAKSIIRKNNEKESQSYKVPSLTIIVPSSARYSFDIITEVGIKSYLEGHKLGDIQEQLRERNSKLNIPLSSLYDQQRKFLYYFGALHRQSAPKIKSYLHQRGDILWLVDGTMEVGTPVFFGIKEAVDGFMLDCEKIATENENDITQFMRSKAEMYGNPDDILHDLSSKISNSCDNLLPNQPHRVCWFHFSRDVGDGLYETPHALLKNRLQTMKLRLQLKDQRKGQTGWLRKSTRNNQLKLVMKDLLKGKSISCLNEKFIGREMYLAINDWILDYANDGNRQGFPFDPYLLYFQRRVHKASLFTNELISKHLSGKKIPDVFFNFNNKLREYLSDKKIILAKNLYEKAFDIFEILRSALDIKRTSTSPLFENYVIIPEQQKKIMNSVQQVRYYFAQQEKESTDLGILKLYKIVNKHIDKYSDYLFPQIKYSNKNPDMICTTNGIEQEWGADKRTIRQIKGTKRLTREFNSLPSEYMLISNLKNPLYVDLILGDISALPEKLSQAAKNVEPYYKWLKCNKPTPFGRLPKKMLRNENLFDDLITVSDKLQ
jgi:hypothetical protein